MADDPAPLLRRARQEARDVDERDERDVERVAGAHEARRLVRGVDVEHAGERARLVADDADRWPPSRAKPQTMFSAQRSLTSRNSPSSTTRRITSCMSYGLFGLSGTSVSSSASSRSAGSVGALQAGCSALFCGRNERR